MKIVIRLISLVFIFLFIAENLLSQMDREQGIGTPKKSQSFEVTLKGEVRDKTTNQLIPNADVTVREATQMKLINKTKTNAQGAYEILIPKGVALHLRAQSPGTFYDARELTVSTDETAAEVFQNFELPSELQLRLNFPTNEFDNPYQYVLDENGEQTNESWQSAIDMVAEDIIKYKDFISKVTITGHTDEDGNDKANMVLGENRAKFLRDELVKRNVPSSMIIVRSAGESELLPKRENEDANMWKKRCRRVVMTKEMKK